MRVLGERWTILVLREIFLGIRRFDDMRERTEIPRQVLTNRLATLVDQGLVRRVPYQEPGARVRDEYRLTTRGLDLYPALIALLEWGDRYLADATGPAVVMRHRDCDEPVRVELRCAAGHEVAVRDALPRPGPGAVRRGASRAEGDDPIIADPRARADKTARAAARIGQ